jgi:tripartite ATP-independent transporter DctP family solute receptor
MRQSGRRRWLLAVPSLGVALAVLVLAVAVEAQTKLVLGHSTAITDPTHQSALIFAKEFEKLTKGQYVVEVYPADQLGKYDEQLQALRLGTQDIQLMDPNALDRYDTLAGLHVYPFLFRDADHFFKVYRGPVGAEMFEAIRTRTGVRLLGVLFRGYRELTTVKRPIQKLDDVKGLKIRVPPAKVFVETWKTLGANPTPMVWGEVYLGLKQGLIDAQENPFAIIYHSKIYEVTKYLVLTHHAAGFFSFFVNDKKFQAFPPDVQAAFRAAVQPAEEHYNQFVAKEQAQLLDELRAKGMEVLTPDLGPFRERIKALDAQFPDYQPWLAKVRGL